MESYLEWHAGGQAQRFQLDADRITIGKDPANGLVLAGDAAVSRTHAVVERLGSAWCIRDLDSKNGTYVNGERISVEKPLRAGDQIRVGSTTLVLQAPPPQALQSTEASLSPPVLTRREQEVLLCLCRPLVSGDVFTEPASIRQIASELVITEAAVKQHLLRLYDKFRLHDTSERRRVRLANEAMNRGLVRLADLRRTQPRR